MGSTIVERRVITVQGIVQGVGFRPFVYGLAARFELGGFVRNRSGDVLIEVEGERTILDQFTSQLLEKAPPLARIEEVSWERQPARRETEFRIEESEADAAGDIFISPDVATCTDCLAELFDPADRRYRYPFLNCTNCGPRLTIVTGAPYDRDRTTMASFAMCTACRAEYEDPGNRRFHAQPTACPVCGPRLELLDNRGNRIETNDPLSLFAAALRAGKIGAMKGLGGYHLLCDAGSEAAVSELRRRKERDEKPFAIMVADDAAAEALCDVSGPEKELLQCRRRPIVLLRKRSTIPVAQAVAPRNPYLGVMLPYTPLHHLLMNAMEGIPLVMTSGNRSDEPIAYEDHDALERLGNIADLFLTHNRPIHVPCDDPVTRVLDGQELPLRRSRGYAPQPITLPFACPCPILAVGGQLKGTFALGRGRHAIISQHMGDLDRLDAYRAFVHDIDLYQELFDIQPVRIAHDLHPDYASTRYAKERGSGSEKGSEKGTGPFDTESRNYSGMPKVLSPFRTPNLVAVQHHHAHLASCMAEHGLREPVIGVTFDGSGYGTDGAIWGGEFLLGDYRQFRRAAHLRYVGLPGGDMAIKEPWRMALAHLLDAREDPDRLRKRLPAGHLQTVQKMIERRFNTPLTSSVGRLFDAVASLAGLRDRVSFEGQAAMELEWLASEMNPVGDYPFDIVEIPIESSGAGEAILEIDTRLLIRAAASDAGNRVEAARIGRKFHSTLMEIIAAVCARLRKWSGLNKVILSGGVFMNALLTSEVSARLQGDDFQVYRHRLVPPNDGGLCLGQLAVAASISGEPGA